MNHEFDHLGDIFQTESLLHISVEGQIFLYEYTSECSVVDGQCSLKAAPSKRASFLLQTKNWGKEMMIGFPQTQTSVLNGQ